MSTSRLRSSEGAFAVFGSGLLLAIATSGLLYFGLGIDLLSYEGFGIPCIFHAATGFACPGCGMTRALVLASQLHGAEALRMNPLIFPLVAFAAYAAMRPWTPKRAAPVSAA